MTDKITIRVDLEGGTARKFEIVKKILGLKQNTEVVRNLISDAYLKIPPQQVEAVELEVAA